MLTVLLLAVIVLVLYLSYVLIRSEKFQKYIK